MHAWVRERRAIGRFVLALAALLPASLAARAQTPPPSAAPAPSGKVTVSDVVITGNRLVPTQEVMSLLKTRPGKEYSGDTTQDDVRTLYATKKFGNIQVELRPDGADKVKVYFLIRDYPNLVEEVEFRGAKHLKDEKLIELTGIRKGMPLNPVANKLACQTIVRKFQEDGRPYAACDLLSGDKAGDTKVIFNITEGPIVRIRGIQFVGNSFVSGPVLATHINASRKLLGFIDIGGQVNIPMIDNDVRQLEEYYKSFGYLDVRVGRELRYEPDGRNATLIFHIQEGQRYRFKDSPKVVGAKFVPQEQLEALSKIKAGEFYNGNQVEKDVSKIKDYIGETGRQAKVQADQIYHRDGPGMVTVNYQVEERPPARVGQVFIVGNERTRQNVILRQVPLFPGQVLTYPDLRLAERNLARLNIFEVSQDGGVRPTVSVLDPDSDSEFKDIMVQVQETSTGSLLFGVGVNSDAGLTGSIVLNERNFDILRPPTSFEDLLSGNAWRGGGQEFRAEAVPGTQLQRYSVSFREPFLFDSLFSFGASGYFYTRAFNEYNETRYGGRFTLGRKLNPYWSVNGSLRIENVGVFDVPSFAPTDYTSVQGYNFQAGARIGLTYDSRDSYLRPTEGFLVEGSFEQVVGDRNFPLASLDANAFFTVYQRADGSGRHVLAAHSQLSWAGDNTPVYERYFAGGFRSIRGFQFRGVSPDVNGFKVGGDFMFLNSLEYQIPVLANDQVFVVGFVDSGTVEPRIDKISDYRVTAGFGVRFVVPMFGPVPIALDFGFPIAQKATDNDQVFSFWLGFFR